VLQASGTSEEEAALAMLEARSERTNSLSKRITLGADKKYDYRGFVDAARAKHVTMPVAQREDRRSAIDEWTTRHPGYLVSQRKRKRIEEVFGWGKTVGLLRGLVYRGLNLVNWVFAFRMAVYNLVRLKNLGVASA
jgi:hypothetical protein